MDVCKFENCNGGEYVRGLCAKHWQQCEAMVHRKLTSYHELEQLGLINPRKWYRSISGTSDMCRALKAAREQRGESNWCGDFI